MVPGLFWLKTNSKKYKIILFLMATGLFLSKTNRRTTAVAQQELESNKCKKTILKLLMVPGLFWSKTNSKKYKIILIF